MTGFKTGASDDDPLGASDDDKLDEIQEPEEEQTESSHNVESIDDASAPALSALRTENSKADGLPWIYQRNSITDGRVQTVQLHLQQATVDREHDALRDIPMGDRPEKADLREAAYLVGLTHLEEVAGVLKSWGYDEE